LRSQAEESALRINELAEDIKTREGQIERLRDGSKDVADATRAVKDIVSQVRDMGMSDFYF
jgi:uncharacterized protein YoxC